MRVETRARVTPILEQRMRRWENVPELPTGPDPVMLKRVNRAMRRAEILGTVGSWLYEAAWFAAALSPVVIILVILMVLRNAGLLW